MKVTNLAQFSIIAFCFDTVIGYGKDVLIKPGLTGACYRLEERPLKRRQSMPIFDVKGLLAQKGTRMQVVEGIENWISSIGSLELEPEHIFPRVHDSKHITQKNPGKLVTIDIRELFTVGYNKKARTKKERKEICDALKKGFNQLVEGHEWAEDEVRPENLVIFISMRDRDEHEYDSCFISNGKSIPTKSSDSGYYCGVEE